LSLTGITWIRLGVWLVVGMVIYFSYGVHQSRVQRQSDPSQKVEAGMRN